MNDEILSIQNLNVNISNSTILNNFNIKICNKETHVIMGPNGSGKSTLCKVLAGHPYYKIVSGKIIFFKESLIDILPEQRVLKGLFLAFQNPIEILGLTNSEFLRIIFNQKQKYLHKKELDPIEFSYKLENLKKKFKLKETFLIRDLNCGFSGGEKKLNEILQMFLLKPYLAILDEIDSGLDIDALKLISQNIIKYMSKNTIFSILLITHYAKIIRYIKPSYLHVMIEGKIIKTGSISLLRDIEKYGYIDLISKI